MRRKQLLVTVLKYGITIALVVWVLNDARGHDRFTDLVHEPKQWGLLAAAWLLCAGAVVLTIVRWFLLVRALGLPFSLKDAFRLGFLGYLFNFVSLGTVGGDLFKAVFIAREQPRRRAEAVATVVIDRVFGLYGLFLVATVAILFSGDLSTANRTIWIISRSTLVGTVLGAMFVFALLTPGFTRGAVSEFLTGLPRTGRMFAQLINAVRMYRRQYGVLAAAGLMSIGVHVLLTLGVYLVSQGLPGGGPSLTGHFIVVPLAMVASALPLPLGALGAFEKILDFLYQSLPTATPLAAGQGVLVALAYRVVTVVIAGVGAGFYLVSRREVDQVWEQAEEAEPAPANA